ncbi:MAG: efflux RND transporter permease subunit [Spirochaetota bacterium]
MRKVIEFIFARPVLVSMFALGLLLFGLLSFYSLHFSLFPSTVYPGLSIKLEYPGADAIKIEKVITWPLEDSISLVGGIRDMRSYTEAGKVKINLEFESEVDLDFKTLEVKERIDLVSHTFPREAHSPTVFRYDPDQVPVVILSFKSKKFDLTQVREAIERNLKPELENVEGVSQVSLAGGRLREVLVSCDRQQLEAYGISLREVSRALSRNNVNGTVGKIDRAGRQLKIYSLGRFKDLYEIRNLPVSRAYGKNPVLIRDIASVNFAFRDKDNSSRIDGKETVSVYVYKTFAGDVLQMSRAVLDKSAALQLPGIRYSVTFNRGEVFRKVFRNLFFTFILAVAFFSLFIYHHLQDTFPILVNLLTLVSAFFLLCLFLFATGIAYDLLAIAGIAFAALVWCFFFFLVRSYPRRGRFPRGYHSFGWPLVFLALCLLLSPFLLWMFHSEMGRNLLATGLSAIVFFTSCYFLFPIYYIILPRDLLTFAVADWLVWQRIALYKQRVVEKTLQWPFLQKQSQKYPKVQEFSQQAIATAKKFPASFYDSIGKLYPWIFAKRKWWKYAVAALIILSAYSLYFAKKEIGIKIEDRELIAYLEFPPGTNFAFTDKITKKVEKKLIGLGGIKQVVSKVDPGKSFLILKVHDYVVLDYAYKNFIKNSVGKVDPAYLYFSSDSTTLTTREVIIDVTGIELKSIREFTTTIANRVKSMQDVDEVVMHFKPPRDEMLLYIKGYRLWRAGLTLPEIGDFLKLAIQGGIATKFITENREVDVRVRFAKKYRKNKNNLKVIRIKNHLEKFVPLSEIIIDRKGSVPMKIYHKNKKRLFSFSIKFADVSNRTIQKILAKILQVSLPDNYEIAVGKKAGRSSAGREANYLWALAGLPLLLFVCLASYYESFLQAWRPSLVISVFLLLLVSVLYFWTYRLGYASYQALFLAIPLLGFLCIVVRQKGAIRLSLASLQEGAKRKRPYFFFIPMLAMLSFWLPFFLFMDGAALFVYNVLFIVLLALVLFAFLGILFLQVRSSKKEANE